MTANRPADWNDPRGQTGPDTVPPPPGAFPSDHLLEVAGAVTQDAAQVWADLWGQFKDHVTPDGRVLPDLEKGFVPACGWGEFMEKFWLLKHYLDSVSRVCKRK